ncbi:MAG: formyltransferase family protein [Trueperaceae bacterium]|nr:formyltransferase family protein [Trueperaceae bacterium]
MSTMHTQDLSAREPVAAHEIYLDGRVVVFGYNFPHKKTQEVLLHMYARGLRIDTVLAADPVTLSIPPSTRRTKIRHRGLIHPREVAAAVGAEYIVLPHNSAEAAAFLQEARPKLGVIAGARILRACVIEPFELGVINLHPGLLPNVRGLDSMLWAIHDGLPLGVTSHLIDARVDAGRVLIRRPIDVLEDDTLLDLSERLFETELELIAPSVAASLDGSGELLRGLPPSRGKMPPQVEQFVVEELFQDYRARMSRGFDSETATSERSAS